MTAFTIDLPLLPSPGVVETLDYESILSEMLTDLQAREPSFTALVESDPAFKVLEVAAYRELLLRRRVNDAAKAVMLAFAQGADLDHIGANYRVPRLVIDPGDPTAVPPLDPVYEADDDYRNRIQLSFEGFNTAGSVGAYVFYALSANAGVKNVQAVSPAPGAVTVYVLSRTGNGAANGDLLAAVEAALNADNVRPLTDSVTVLSASVVNYTIEAELVMYPGPDAEVVRQAAVDALTAYTRSIHRVGYDVALSAVMAALQQAGVQRVRLIGTTPAPDAQSRLVEIGEGEAPYCTLINVTIAGATDV